MTEYADGENAARLWPRGVAAISAIIEARTYFELPRSPRPTLPCIVVSNARSRLDNHGYTVTTLTYEVYAETKKAASDLAFLLATQMKDLTEPVTINAAECVLVGADAESVHQIPGSDWAKKYAVTGWLMLRQLT